MQDKNSIPNQTFTEETPLVSPYANDSEVSQAESLLKQVGNADAEPVVYNPGNSNNFLFGRSVVQIFAIAAVLIGLIIGVAAVGVLRTTHNSGGNGDGQALLASAGVSKQKDPQQQAINNSILEINRSTVINQSFAANGDVLVQSNQDTANAFKVQSSSGDNILVADTKDKKVTIGDQPPGNVSLAVNGDITVNGQLVSTSQGYSLSSQGLTIGGVLVCTSRGCVSNSSPPPTPASPSIDVANLMYLNTNQTVSGAKTFSAATAFNAKVTVNAPVQVAGNVNSAAGFSVGGVAGGSFSCGASQLLQQAVISGGIITSGSCVTVAGSSTPTLQDVYDASAPANVVLSNASGVFSIQDAASPLATNLFEVGSNGNSTLYFAVNNLGISVTGNVNTTGQYQVGGAQISSANLSNDANLAKLSGNQTFSGNNTFSSASNSFTGNGAGLTNVNAAQLNGQAGSYYTNATNISAGTLSDARLSNNVALLNALQTFSGQNTFSNASNSFTGNGSNLTSLNASNVSSGTLNDLRLSPNVTLAGNTFNGASQLVQLTAGGILPVLNGSNLTSLNATNISSGTLDDARLSSNVALLDADNIFLGDDSFHLNSTALAVQDAVSPLAGNLFEVTDNTGATKYFEVSASGVKINGDDVCTAAGNCTGVTGIGGSGTAGKIAKFTGSGTSIGDSLLSESGSVVAVGGSINIATGNTYQINGSQISSAALSNDSNLAKLDGTQAFTGANTFSNSSNSFTGDGAGLSNVDAAKLNGQAGSYYTNATNISSGTLSDARLSSNVALKDGNNTFTGNNVFSLNTAGLAVQDAASPLGTNLFEVTDNAGTTKYFTVSATSLQFNGEDVCTAGGNCTGVTGIGGSGTAGKLAKFTGTGSSVGDSLISDNGSTVTVGGVLAVNTITPTSTLTVGTPTQTLTLQGDGSTSLSAKSGSFTNTLVFAAPALASHTITIPNASGTVAVSASGPLSLDAAGNLTCPTCLTSGGGGGTAGVSSVNSLTGDITLAGTANQIIITPSSNTLTFSLPQDISTSSTPDFAGIDIGGNPISSSDLSDGANLAKLDGDQTFTGANTFSNAGNSFTGDGAGLTNLNASNISSGTLNDARLSSNVALLNRTGQIFTGDNTIKVDSSSAFQVQNAGGGNLLNVDTSNGNIILNGLNAAQTGAWTTQAGNLLPGNVSAAGHAQANGYIYLLGGYSGGATPLNSVYYAKLNADGSTGVWQSANNLPQNRSLPSAVAVNGYLYLLGGQNDSFNSTNTVYYAKLNADGSTGVWQSANNLPDIRSLTTAAAYNGYIYLLGGYKSGSTDTNTVYYAKLNADGSLGAWFNQASNLIPQVVENASTVVANGYIYVLGGYVNATAVGNNIFYAKLNADGSTGPWTNQLSNQMPGNREATGAVVMNGYVYVLAGDGDGAYQPTIFYAKLNADGSTGAWTSQASNQLPVSMAGPAIFTANGYIEVVGGFDGTNWLNSVYYAPTSRIQIGGSLDLVGLAGGTLTDGGTQSFGSLGGSITAGNITAVGDLAVQGQGSFQGSLATKGDLTVANNGYFGGELVVGNTASVKAAQTIYPGWNASTAIDVEQTDTSVIGDQTSGIINYLTLNPSAAPTASTYLSDNEVQTKAGNSQNFGVINALYGQAMHFGSGNVTTLSGTDGYVFNESTGSVQNAIGGNFGAFDDGGGGSIQNAYGVQIQSGTGNVTNNYGLYVQDQSGAGSTLSYNIYSAGSSSKNFFAGSLEADGNTLVKKTSATAFQVQSSAAAETLFTVDSSARSASGGNLIKIGNNTGADGATTILVVDSATAAPTSNLSALNGGLYYNSTTNHVNVIENGAVKELCNKTDLGCGNAPTTTLQQAYDNSSSPATITTSSTAKTVLLKAGASSDANNLFAVQNAAGGSVFQVDSVNRYVGINNSSPNAALDINASSVGFTFGFETGTLGAFNTSSSGQGNPATASNSSPRTGSYSAYLGNWTALNGGQIDMTLTKTLSAAGTVSFWCKGNLLTGNGDSSSFLVDGVVQDTNGCFTASYTQLSFAVGSGAHTFDWRVVSGFWQSANMYVDDVQVTNAAGTPTAAIVNGGNVGIGTSAPNSTLDVAGTFHLQAATDSATLFQIQNASAADTLLTVDSSARSASGGNLIKVGNGTGTDVDTTILVVDSATAAPTSNLSALNGGLFYNSTTNHLNVIENGAVKEVCNKTDLGCGSASTPSPTSQTKVVAMGTATGCTGSSPVASADTLADYVVTSCTSAQTTINTAITALGATGGTVYLKEGTYIIDGSINMASNITLAGSGPGTVLKLKDGINAGINLINTSNNVTNEVIKNLKLDGNRTNNTSGTQTAILAQNVGSGAGTTAVSGIKIDQVTVQNFRDHGFNFSAFVVKNSSVTNSHFINNGTEAISMIGASGSNNIVIANNIFQGNSSGVYANSNTANLTISGNMIEGSTSKGIYVFGSVSGVTISGNTVVSSGNNGIDIQNSPTNVTVTGNTVSASTGDGISLVNVVHATVTGNLSYSNTSRGMMVNTCSYITVTGNTFTGNTSNGIQLFTATSSTINGNTIDTNSSDGIYSQNNSNYNNIVGNSLNGNTGDGIKLVQGSDNNVSNNEISGNTSNGVEVGISMSSTTINGNKIRNNGGSGSSSGIYVGAVIATAPDKTYITNNTITDTAGTGYAINVSGSGGGITTSTFLSNNSYSGTGASSLNDVGTGTSYGNQLTTGGGFLERVGTDSTAAFQVQSASGAETLFTVDTTARSASGGNLIKIGNSTGTDTNTTILVVDSATAAPTSNLGVLNGGLFYNSTTNHLNVIENGTVKELCNKTDLGCGSAATPTLAQVYGYGASTSDSVLSLDTTRGGVVVKDSLGGIGGTLFGVQSSTGTKYLDVTSAGISTTNLSVAAGGYISIAGGNTASRPGAPTEGMLYYDSSTKSLLVYANGKWQADRSSSTKIVAMGTATGCTGSSPVSSLNADSADYVVTSCTSAQTTINSAITALGSTGGTVYLEEGTYIIDGQINMASNVTLAGSGPGTVLKLKDGINASINTLVSSSVSRVTFRDFKLDGNRTNNTSGTQIGLYMSTVGSGSGTSAVPGYTVDNVTIQNFRSSGIYLNGSANSSITRNNIINNGGEGIHAQWPTSNVFLTINGNTVQGNSSYGIYSDIGAITYSTISNNTLISNSNDGIYMNGSNNSIDSNTIYANSGKGVELQGGNNTVTGNNVSSNTNDGIYTHGANNTISGNTSVSNSGFGIDTDNVSSNNSVSGNKVSGNSSGGINLGGSTNQASANTVISNTNIGIKVTGSNNTVSGNTVSSNTTTGIYVNCCNSNNNIVSSNQVSSNGSNGITVDASNGNQISANRVYDNGGSGSSSSILVFANAFNTPDKNIIKDNVITDTAGTGYAIELSGGLKPTNTYISNNAFSGTGATAILDTGTTGTTYINQSKSTTSDYLYRFGSDSGTAFQVQNAGGSESLLSIDTTARSASGGNLIKIGNSTGTDTATTILVLDGATAAPTSNLGALSGGLFYNSTTSHINVIENGVVKELCNKTDLGCGSASTPTLSQVYGYGANTGDSTIGLDSTRGGIIIKDNSTPISGSLFSVQDSSSNKYLDVSSSKITVGENTVANATATATTATTSGTGTNTTTVALTAVNSLANGDVIFIDNAGQDYFTRITAGGGTTSLTVDPAVTYEDARTVTKYNVQYLGSDGTNFTGATRNQNSFYQGYFLGGVVTGAGSTVYSDANIQSAGNLRIDTVSGVNIQGTNSTNAFQIQDSTGSAVLNADTTNKSVTVSGTGLSTPIFTTQATGVVSSWDFEGAVLSPFTSSGTVWTISNTQAHGGTYSARAGVIGNNGSTTVQLSRTLTVNGTITYWLYQSSEANQDYTRFYIDGVQQSAVSGVVNSWVQYSFPVTAGAHTFSWTYSKDCCFSSGADTAFIDDVSLTNDSTPNGSGVAAAFLGGRVGIGTSTPGAALEVDGDVQILGSGGNPPLGNLYVGGTQLIKTTSVTALQVQDSSGLGIFSVDTSGKQNNLSANTIVKPTANSANTFQVQNSSGQQILNVSTANNSITIPQGNLIVSGLSTPQTPTLSTSATGGTLAAATYYYQVAAVNANGSTPAVPSNPTSVTTSGSTSQNTLTWTAVTNAANYKVYRSTDGANWKVNTVASTLTSIVDNGTNYTWGTAGAIPTTNTTGGNLTVNGGATFANLVNSTNALDVQDATGDSILRIDSTDRFIGINNSSPVATLDVVASPPAPDFSWGFEDGTYGAFTHSGSNSTLAAGYAHSGSYGWGNGGCNDGGVLTLNRTLSSAGTISFWMLTNGVWGGNGAFYIDGVDKVNVDGNGIPYTYFTFPLTSGSHTFVWQVPGGDCDVVFVDDVTVGVNAATSTAAIFNGGNVGIGTTAPSQSLEVDGTSLFKAKGSDSSTLFQIQNAAGTGMLTADSTNMKISVSNSNFLVTDLSAPSSPAVVAGATTGGTLSGAAGTTYYYKVSAISGSGESLASIEVSINGQSFTKLSAPGAPTVGAPAAGGSVDLGTHSYQVTFVTANGETGAGTTSAQVNVTTGGTQTVPLTAIPTGPTGTTSRKIYRTVAGDTGSYKLVGTIANNTTTTFNDTVADASLGAVIPASNTATTSTNTATVSWTAVPGAASYRIYRGTASGAESAYQTSTSSPFTDTGTAGTAGSLPTRSTVAQVGIGTAAPLANLDVEGTALFKNALNSTAAFQVQDVSSSSMLTVNTNNKYVQIGSATTDAAAVLTVLDSYNNGTDPSGTNGAMYYNTSLNAFRCFTNGAWANCNASSTNLQNAYDNSSTPATITTSSSTKGVVIAAGASNDNTSLFKVQNAAGGSLLNIDSINNAISLLGNDSGQLGAWQTNTNTISGRGLLPPVTAVANGYIYTFGGYDGSGYTNTVQYAKLNSDGSTGVFNTTSSLPANTCDQTIVTANGYVYSIGGCTTGGGPVASVYYARMYSDGTLGTWTTSTNPLPAVRYYSAGVYYNGYIYEFGGNNGSTAQSTVYYTKVNSDGSIGAWQTAANALPAAVNEHTAVAANGYAYVIGGGTTVYYAKFNADGSMGTWTTSTNPLPVSRIFFSSVVSNGYIYTIGGGDNAIYFAKLNNNGSTSSWSTNTTTLPAARGYQSSAVYNGYVYVIGGNNNPPVNNTVYYASTARLQVGANLDLIGLQGQNLADAGDISAGSAGGSITAGNITAVGTLQVQGAANFSQSMAVNGNLSVAGQSISLGSSNSGETTAWSTNANSLPAARQNLVSTVVNGYVYAIGGNNGTNAQSSVYYAKLNTNGSTGTWNTNTASLPALSNTPAIASANGYIYIVGGETIVGCCSGSAATYYGKVNSDGSISSWATSSNSLPLTLYVNDSTIVNGYLYTFGGYNNGAGGAQSGVYYTKINADGSIGAWNTNTNALPAARYNSGVFSANGYMYVVGGDPNSGNGGSNTVYYAKINTNGSIGTWTSATNTIPDSVQGHTVGVANGYVYVIGGYDSSLVAVQTVYFAKLNSDGSVGAWSTSINKLPTTLYFAGEAYANGYFYTIGGNITGSPSATVYYASTSRISVGGTLDLIGLGGQNLTESSGSGGDLAANNGVFVGGLQVQGAAGFAQSMSVTGNLSVSGSSIVLGDTSGQLGAWATNQYALGCTTVGCGSPATRNNISSVTANGYVYTIGGVSSGSAQSTVYYAKLNSDGSTGAWSTNANALPDLRWGQLSMVANGYVYVIGGGNNSGSAQTTVYYAKLNSDGSTGAWSTNANALPAGRFKASGAVANGYIYVLGGNTTTGGTQLGTSTVYYAKLNADGSVGAWSTSSNTLLAALWEQKSVVANGYIYVIGGTVGSTGQSTVYYAKLNSDGSTGAWSTNANPLTAARQNFSSVVSNGYVYVLGGGDVSNAAQATVYYAKLNNDGSTSTWSTNANALPAVRNNAAAVTANGYVYLVTGDNGSQQSTVYYASAARVQIGANLDLVGLQGQTLADGGDSSAGSTGGSITAGNGTFVGALQVQGSASFAQGLSVTGNFSVNNVLYADSTNMTITLGQASATPVLLVLGNKNTSGDPACTEGAIYYNSSAKQFRACVNSTWVAFGSPIVKTVYNTPVGGMTSATTATFNNNTTARCGMFNIAGQITVNSISFRATAVTTAGTISLGVYSEDGQTQYFNVTTASISVPGVVTTSVSSVTLTPGNYYMCGVPVGTANITANFWAEGMGSNDIQPAGKYPTQGPLTVAASTLPATFDPATITFSNSNLVSARLDN